MEKDNFNRNYMVNLLGLHNSLTISELAKIMRVSRPTIYLHLDILEKKGLIKRTKDKEKKGAPVTISLIEKNYNEDTKGKIAELLSVIKKGEFDHKELFEKTGISSSNFIYLEAGVLGLFSKKMYLTKDGEKFLRLHSKKKGANK